jgi:hypothetical protein
MSWSKMLIAIYFYLCKMRKINYLNMTNISQQLKKWSFNESDFNWFPPKNTFRNFFMGGGVAELIASQLMEPKVGGLNPGLTRKLFELMVDGYSNTITHVLYVRVNCPSSQKSPQINILRSAWMSIQRVHLKKFHRQPLSWTSWLPISLWQ